jgi:hypothetical protein
LFVSAESAANWTISRSWRWASVYVKSARSMVSLILEFRTATVIGICLQLPCPGVLMGVYVADHLLF